jgi:hypothetical protein
VRIFSRFNWGVCNPGTVDTELLLVVCDVGNWLMLTPLFDDYLLQKSKEGKGDDVAAAAAVGSKRAAEDEEADEAEPAKKKKKKEKKAEKADVEDGEKVSGALGSLGSVVYEDVAHFSGSSSEAGCHPLGLRYTRAKGG